MRHEKPYGATLHLAAALRERDGAAALRAVCDGAPGLRLALYPGPLARTLRDLAARPAPDAVLLEIDPADPEGIRGDVARLGEALSGVPVIATGEGAEMAQARLLMRLGVRDLIPWPLARDDLLSVLDHIRRRAGRAGGGGRSASRTMAFLKAGGGCGATTLAAQSAVVLARRRTQAEPEVCLLDLDMQFGAAALTLDLDDRVGLGDLLEARGRIDGALLRSVMGHHDSGLDVLAAPRTLMPLDALNGDFVSDCLALARAEYQTVVLDLPLAWTAWSHAALKQCDLIVLVARLGVASVRRARRQLEALRAHGLGGVPTRLVLNRAERAWGVPWGGGARRREAERALGRPFDFTVANDERALRDALDRGVPLAEVARWSRVNRDLVRLADGLALALAGGSAGGSAKAGEPESRGRRIALSEAP